MQAAYDRLMMKILQQQTTWRGGMSLTNLNAENNWANVGGGFRVISPPTTNVSAAINSANVEDLSGLDLTLKL